VLAAGASLWALLVAAALVFAKRAARAQARLETQPLKTFGGGLLVAVTAGVIGIGLVSQPSGLLKLFGWVVLLGLLALSALGGGGLALLVGARIRETSPRLTPFAALGRATGLLVAATWTPILGWFVVLPLGLVAALGAGVQATFARPRTASQPPVPMLFAGGGSVEAAP